MANKHSLLKSSIFTSFPSIFIALLLCIISALYGKPYISFGMAILSVFAFSARVWANAAGKGLEATLKIKNPTLFQGDREEVILTVRNTRLLAVAWMKLLMPFSEKESIISENTRMPSSNEARELIFMGSSPYRIGEENLGRLLWYEEKEYRIKLEANKRGITRTSLWHISTGDGFGLSETDIPLKSTDITVYPKIVDIDTSIFKKDILISTTGEKGLVEDRTALKGIRNYEFGDNAKYINWRLLARGEKMKSNVYENIEPKSIHIIFDGESFSHAKDEGELEEALSIIASATLALSDIDIYISFPDTKGHKAHTIVPRDGKSAILTSLAGYEVLEDKIDEHGIKIVKQDTIFDIDSILDSLDKCSHFFYISYRKSDIGKQCFIDMIAPNRITVLYKHDDANIAFKSIPIDAIRRAE